MSTTTFENAWAHPPAIHAKGWRIIFKHGEKLIQAIYRCNDDGLISWQWRKLDPGQEEHLPKNEWQCLEDPRPGCPDTPGFAVSQGTDADGLP